MEPVSAALNLVTSQKSNNKIPRPSLHELDLYAKTFTNGFQRRRPEKLLTSLRVNDPALKNKNSGRQISSGDGKVSEHEIGTRNIDSQQQSTDTFRLLEAASPNSLRPIIQPNITMVPCQKQHDSE